MNEAMRSNAGVAPDAPMLTAGCRGAPATLINASVRAAYLAGVYDGFIRR